MRRRIQQLQQFCQDILKNPFDFSGDDWIELENDKRSYCGTEEELKLWWQKRVKYLTLIRLLELRRGQDKAQSRAAQEAQAREAVIRSMHRMFERMLTENQDVSLGRYWNALISVFDPHSNYLPPRERENFDIDMSGTLEGIGALLGESDGLVKVADIVPGGPAWRQGQLKAEDVILKVAQGSEEPVDVVEMSVYDVVSLVRGKKGTEVSLTVRKPDGRVEIVPLIRDVVLIQETYARSAVLQLEKNKRSFGYLAVPKFYHDFQRANGRTSAEDVRQELERLKKIRVAGVILDLRGNTGGALDDAVKMAGLFIEKGPVVQVRGRFVDARVFSDDDAGVVYHGPLVILVDAFSASASEIVAAAMQDYGRALIVGGDHTFGKGTVQVMLDLDRYLSENAERFRPLGSLALTIQKFYRVNGGSNQYKGVIPDIVLPELADHLEIGEKNLDYALSWDTIEPVSYPRWSDRLPDLAMLKHRDEERVLANQRFTELKEHIRFVSEQRGKTLLNMNLAVYQKEQEKLQLEVREYNTRQKTSANMRVIQSDAESALANPAELDHQRQQEWFASLGKDPVIEEALWVLNDVVDLQH
jgi:carboxyl-terminal processing protease